MTNLPKLPVAAAMRLLLLASLAAGCAPSGEPAHDDSFPERPTSLLLITIDTLRADHLGAYGYSRDTSPVLDAFAEESILFETCLTPMATTLPAHTSLMTGVHPLEHGIMGNVHRGGRPFDSRTSLRSVAEIARERGLHTAAFVSAIPVGRHTGLARGFEVFEQPESNQRPAGATNEQALPWIDQLGSEPFFLWVHYYDPHFPYSPPAGYDLFSDDGALETYVGDRRIPESSTRPNEMRLQTRRVINGYDGDVRYVDEQIGRLFDRLRQKGLWDEIAVVVTSDHGEGLGEHDMIGHGYVHREQLLVPLMIRVPGHEPRRVTRPVAIQDVLPTTFGLIGEGGWGAFLEQASGHDVLAPGFDREGILSRRSDRWRRDVTGLVLAFTDGRWKYVHEPERGDRLFDWANDPFELDDLLHVEREIAAEMLSRLNIAVRELAARGRVLAEGQETPERPLDPETLEQLKALGYLD